MVRVGVVKDAQGIVELDAKILRGIVVDLARQVSIEQIVCRAECHGRHRLPLSDLR